MSAADRLDRVERLVAERGRSIGPVRVAAGRSGVALGLPNGSLLHLSWAVLLGWVLLARVRRRRR